MTTPVETKPGISRIRRTQTPAKPTPSQLPYALAVIVAIIAFSYTLDSPKLVLFWLISVALGLTLQRSRFCFTAAMRDPVLTGGTSLTKAVVIGLAVGTAGFVALQIGSFLKTGNMADAMKLSHLAPVGLNTLLGGILFGIGAVIAGGCASGTLMRVGEGYLQNMIALVTFIIGSGLGAVTWPYWRDAFNVTPGGGVYLPTALGGFIPALLLQFGLLFAIWLLADWWNKRRSSQS